MVVRRCFMGRKTLLYRQPKPLVTRHTDDVKAFKNIKNIKNTTSD